MPFDREDDYRDIRGYYDNAGGHRQGYMAVGEKLRITDANLSRLDTVAANLAEMRYAILEEKVRAILSAISNEYPDDVFERLIREERFPETFAEISERYAGCVERFDVVNEPSRIYDVYMRDRASRDAAYLLPEDDYCVWMFNLARQYFPANTPKR